jgi:chorismate synthase
VIDGCPAGIEFDEALLRSWMDRRKPGQKNTSARQEADLVEVLSGVYEGKTLGTPIALLVRNFDARSADYSERVQRPGHADDLWPAKFGHADPRCGGRMLCLPRKPSWCVLLLLSGNSTRCKRFC